MDCVFVVLFMAVELILLGCARLYACTVLVSSKEVFLSALLLAHIIMLLNGVSALARV